MLVKHSHEINTSFNLTDFLLSLIVEVFVRMKHSYWLNGYAIAFSVILQILQAMKGAKTELSLQTILYVSFPVSLQYRAETWTPWSVSISCPDWNITKIQILKTYLLYYCSYSIITIIQKINSIYCFYSPLQSIYS